MPRNSAHWMPDIEDLCESFKESSLTKGVVTYRKDVLSEIDAYCDAKVDEIKNEVYCNLDAVTDCLLDRHKIAAIHVVAVLKKKLFLTNAQPSNTTFMDMTANEHCAMLLMKTILLAWHESNGNYVDIDLPPSYNDNLILLFNKYMKSQSSIIIDNMFVYSLANIVYLIEDSYLYPVRQAPL